MSNDFSRHLSNPADLLASKLAIRNIVRQVDQIQRDVNQLKMRPRRYANAELATLGGNLGLMTQGEFRSGNGVEPGAGFTGIRIGYPGFSYNSLLWLLASVANDELEVGISDTDGLFYFGGGAGTIGARGMVTNGLNYFLRLNATNAGYERTFEFGTILDGSDTVPSGYISFYDSAASGNLQTNGDFELGALTDFDTADSGAPSWSAVATPVHGGSYAAQLATTGDAESNLQTNGDFELGALTDWTAAGTGTWTANTNIPHGGTYLARFDGTPGQTGTLTTNLGGTPRMAVTAGLYYQLSAWYRNNAAFSTKQILIKWYTATSGGSLVSTTTIEMSVIDASNWTHTIANYLAPATAAGAEIVINYVRDGTASNQYGRVDDITFGVAQYGTLTTNLGGTPRMAVTAGSSYALDLWSSTDTASASTWATKEARVLWYTATSGGSLISTDTVPLLPGTNTFVNNARALVAPATAAGAEIQCYALRGTTGAGAVNLWIDDITFQAVSVLKTLLFKDSGLTLNGKNFGTTSYALLEQQQTSGTAGGAFNNGADRTVAINTEVYDPDSIVSISGSQFTIAAAGTYLIKAWMTGYRVDDFQSILHDITGTADLKRGASAFSNAGGANATVRSTVEYRHVITAANTYELRGRCVTTRGTDGFGKAGSLGTETYAGVEIIKLP